MRRPPRCVYCWETKPRTIVAGGLAHKRCIPTAQTGQKAGAVVKKTDAGEQQMIPGTETKKDKHIHAMARKYRKLIAERLSLQSDERTAKDKLIGAMEAKKITVYDVDGVCVKLKAGKQKAEVTIPELDGEKDEEEEE